MIEELNFVRGAVADRDVVPALTHLYIKDGWVQGSDSRMAITAYSDKLKKYCFAAPADEFYRAVHICEGSPNIKVQDNFVYISKGKFRVKLPLIDEKTYPFTQKTQGKRYKIPGLLTLLQKLLPFVGEDATRSWACGILFDGSSAYATNNVILVKTTTQYKGPKFVLPSYAIKEIVRLGYEIDFLCVDDHRVTFYYSDGSWVASTLLIDHWPDVSKILVRSKKYITNIEQVKNAVEKVAPFCPDPKHPYILLNETGVHTQEGNTVASVGGICIAPSAFHSEVLLKVLRLCTHIDFTKHPNPCPFKGDGIEGVVTGVRV